MKGGCGPQDTSATSTRDIHCWWFSTMSWTIGIQYRANCSGCQISSEFQSARVHSSVSCSMPTTSRWNRGLSSPAFSHSDFCCRSTCRRFSYWRMRRRPSLTDWGRSIGQTSENTTTTSSLGFLNPLSHCVAWWCNDYGVGSRHKRSRVRLPAVPLSRNNLGQVVHTHMLLSQSSIIWYRSSGGDALRLGR